MLARAARGKKAARGRLRGFSTSYKPLGGCEEVLVVWRFVQALPYWLFSFVRLFCFYLLFPLFVAGRLTGEEEKGVPRFDSQ